MSDDHAANAISAYGSRLAAVYSTPNIDRIAREGALLHNCFCTNAICTPSRATVLTGQYSHVNGVRTLDDPLPDTAHTFVEDFHGAGYQTACFGKWHLHARPRHFDSFRILPGQGRYIDPYFIHPDHTWPNPDPLSPGGMPNYPSGDQHEGHVTDLITDFTLDWLANRDRSKPFLLCCHHKAPHDRFIYHPRDEHIFDGVEIPEPDSLWENRSHRSDASRDYGMSVSERNKKQNGIGWMSSPGYPTGRLDLTGLDEVGRTRAAYQKYLKDYLRCVKGIDDNVGRLLDYLDEENLTRDTLVVYTSDQGMFLGEHDFMDKRWMYEESMRIPFIARYPQVIPAGIRSDAVISNVDFLQTLLDFAGIDAPGSAQGRSFRSAISGETPGDWADEVYSRYWMHIAHCDNPAHYGIRTDKYKLIFFYGLPLDASGALDEPTPVGWEFYDLVNDPFELNNVYEDPTYAATVETLKRRLREIKEEIGDTDDRYPELQKLVDEYW